MLVSALLTTTEDAGRKILSLSLSLAMSLLASVRMHSDLHIRRAANPQDL